MSPTQATRPPTERCPHHLRPDGFLCPIDWRWQRAEWRLRTRSRRGERQDDEWVRRAFKHQRWARRGITKDSDIAQAQQLLAEDVWKRTELESRILADQPTHEIACRLRVSSGVVQAVEALFFDVRRRLHAQDWVLCNVLGLKMWQPCEPADITLAWRSLGFLCGPTIVDSLVNDVDRDDLMNLGLPAYWSERSRMPKEMQLMLISQSLPINGKGARAMNRLVKAGLTEPLPHFARPPQNGRLEMAGEHDWGELESWMRVSEPGQEKHAKAA